MSATAQASSERRLDIDDNKHANSVLRNFDRMRNERKRCDLIIKVGKEELHVHRYVMMASSDYFDAMFSHDTQESKSGVVEMKVLSFSILKKCVIFIYTGKISIVEDDCEEVLYVANMLQLTEVCDKVAPFLESRINPTSFFNIKKISIRYDLENLNKVCDNFAVKNFDLIVKEKEFYQLEMEYVSFLIKSRKDLKIGTEDSRLQLIIEWIKADVESHYQHFEAMMMNLLDFGKLSESVVENLVKNERICYESAAFMKMLYFTEKSKPKVVAAPPAPVTSEPNAIVVFNKTCQDLRAYRPQQKNWIILKKLHLDMVNDTRYTALIKGEFLYVFMSNSKVYRLQVLKKDSLWIRLHNMSQDHGHFLRATVCYGYIYVAGAGCMEKYLENVNIWKVVCVLGAPCSFRALVTCNGEIYTIGGRSGGPSRGVSSFSPSSLSWSTMKPMLIERQTCAAAVYDGGFFVAGGYCSGALSSVEHYNPKTNVWTPLNQMVQTRDEFSLCVVDNKLFAVGGVDGLQSIEMYDISGNWKIVQEMPQWCIESAASLALHLPDCQSNLDG